MTSVNCDKTECIYNHNKTCTLSYIQLDKKGQCLNSTLLVKE